MSNEFTWFFLIAFVCLTGCQKVEETVESELESTPFVLIYIIIHPHDRGSNRNTYTHSNTDIHWPGHCLA